VLYNKPKNLYNYSIVIDKVNEMNALKVVVRTGRDGKSEVRVGDKSYTTGKTGRALEQVVEYHYKNLTGEKKSYAEIMASSPIVAPKAEKFGINARFGFVEKLVSMVADSVQPSAVITGEGGLGKTYTVTKTLEQKGYTDISELGELAVGSIVNMRKCFRMVKGYSTAKGLYRTLFENNKGIIVFDDCDAVLKDPVALNLLKGALDSYGKRIISWNADMREEDLPRSFNFEGRVIFISNMEEGKIDQAIRSRSMMIDLSMTTDQKIERMATIAASEGFLPEYNAEVKADALELIKELKDDVKEISLRTLISVAKIRASNSDWKDLATYMLTA
jgi:hypothetical protein